MKSYELTYIISSEITAEDAELESKNIETFIQKKEGTILKSEKPSPRTLSYLIKKQSSGFMGILEFQLEPEHINELKEKIQKNNRIIRHMLIIKKPAKIQKERRIRKKPLATVEISPIIKTKEKIEKTNKKVELKEIEEKLEEILSE